MVLKRVPINIKSFIGGLIEDIKNIKKAGQTIFYTHSGSLDFITDASLLKHIVFNLLSNAIKFSGEDTRIDIATLTVNGLLTVSVKDAGIGIPKADREHLFERFFRASNVSNIQGTGLGLHIVSRYVQMLNGTIECNKDTEEGTEMIVRLNQQPISESDNVFLNE